MMAPPYAFSYSFQIQKSNNFSAENVKNSIDYLGIYDMIIVYEYVLSAPNKEII